LSRYPQVPLGEVLRAAPDEVVVEPDEMYRVAGIYSFGRGLFARPTIQGTDTKYKTLFRLREDQFVYSRLKAFEGAVAIVDGQFDGAFVSQEFPQFNAVRERVDPTFLAGSARGQRFGRSSHTFRKGLERGASECELIAFWRSRSHCPLSSASARSPTGSMRR